jgi:hypothetical protein
MSVAAPRRRPAKPKGKRAPRRRILPAFLLAHPGRTAACAVVAAVLTGIVLNAVYFQKGRHPAPLFAQAPTVAPRSVVADIPVPAPRPSDRVFQSAVPLPPASVPVAAPAAVPGPPPSPRITPVRTEPAEQKRDLIGALIKTEAMPDYSDRVAAAQKALMKVGYVLRPDGHMGTGTRKALEQFQRERSLTVTGELDARTLRELQAQSRVSIP